MFGQLDINCFVCQHGRLWALDAVETRACYRRRVNVVALVIEVIVVVIIDRCRSRVV